MTAADTGLPQQLALFEQTIERLGQAPPVIDSANMLADPPAVLAALCGALGVASDPAMLGGRPARAPRTASGRRTGTRPYAPRPASPRRAQRTRRLACPTRSAASSMRAVRSTTASPPTA